MNLPIFWMTLAAKCSLFFFGVKDCLVANLVSLLYAGFVALYTTWTDFLLCSHNNSWLEKQKNWAEIWGEVHSNVLLHTSHLIHRHYKYIDHRSQLPKINYIFSWQQGLAVYFFGHIFISFSTHPPTYLTVKHTWAVWDFEKHNKHKTNHFTGLWLKDKEGILCENHS